MMTPHLSLSPSLFARAFPFHFIFNREGEVIQAGEVMQRITLDGLIGSQVEQYFQIIRPKVEFDFEAIHKQSRSLFLLESLHNGMQLKGQMMLLEDQEVMCFLGSPWVTDTASLGPLGLKLKDFAIHDPIVDFLFLLQAKNTALMDTKKLTDELTQQQAQLRSALQIKESLAEIAEAQAKKLKKALHELQNTQTQLIQTEKMSGLGQLVAGIAHEINNPINFIYGNIQHANEYIQDLIGLLQLYQQSYPEPRSDIQARTEEIDITFLLEDLPQLLNSMKVGTDRIRQIVLSLRNFSRLDEAEMKAVDIHEGIDSTLLILQSRLKARGDCPAVKVIKNYGNLPLVECYAGQLNQVFMNLLSNAIDALEAPQPHHSRSGTSCHTSTITITTEVDDCDQAVIRIGDNGPGMTEAVRARLFDPFFTTKPVGKGTGLGLSISYQIVVEKHQGTLHCISEPGMGAEFRIEIPLRRFTDRETVHQARAYSIS
ncbi:histidine kinase [Leptolyngbya sp. 'hensonii']|uniref:ATP-binding protein n=1 Tax=Leptolyngbya sp. 'hensonii' TaxID=1922337 RepID=UPI00095033B3|nr:ATP-binding protein [Leptolyngbya sp. 'hensonii']OLP16558.1 histidine kinase [Leptolyngbya sp. 'hensonii']